MSVNGRPTARQVFAAELKRARDQAGMSQDGLGEAVQYSGSTVAMVEICKRVPSEDFGKRCDEVLGTGERFAMLAGLIGAERSPEWFRPWLELEREATALWSWEPLLVPGLLQTEGYVRAVLGDDERVAARIERQKILDNGNSPMLVSIIDEGVLRRPIGGAKVMSGQLQHLADLADRVLVQVIPTQTGMHAGLMGAFVLGSFDSIGKMAYVDTASRGYVIDNPADVAAVERRWEALRAEALPRSLTLKLLGEVAQTWNG